MHAVEAIPDGVRLLDIAGAPISPPVPARDWCLGALQGVIMIKAADGTQRTFTYETTVPKEEVDCVDYFKHPASWTRAAGRSRFGVSTGPFGDGAGGFQVVPFRSIAVDTRLIPLGTVLYVPAARGTTVTLASGRRAVHDGYFFTSDRGGAIKDNHIDVFVGLWAANPFPSFIWSTETRTFEAYVVADEVVKPRLHRLHALDDSTSTPAGTLTIETNPAYKAPVAVVSSPPLAEAARPNAAVGDWASNNRTPTSQRYSPAFQNLVREIGAVR